MKILSEYPQKVLKCIICMSLSVLLVVSFIPNKAFADSTSQDFSNSSVDIEDETNDATESSEVGQPDSDISINSNNEEKNLNELNSPEPSSSTSEKDEVSTKADSDAVIADLADQFVSSDTPAIKQVVSEEDLNLSNANIIDETFDSEQLTAPNQPQARSNSSNYASSPSVSYSTHVQKQGWQDPVNDGEMSGTEGQALRLEGIKITVQGDSNLGVTYRTHVQKQGWQDPVNDGEMSGTEGQALRLEAIQIALTGSSANNYDIYYRVHAQHFGWLDWTCNGYAAGTAGYGYRLEAIEIQILPKGAGAPGVTEIPYYDGNYGIGAINYKTHVQKQGWQDWTWNGGLSGTSGQALRLEGIRINTEWIEGLGVTYRTHVQKIGWQDWVSDGALSGTEGQALRLEAIQIKLTGEQANNYDVYYRVHSQKYGWLGWAKNGESAGTSNHAFRLEAIQIVLTPKGSSEPTPSNGRVPAVEAYNTEEGQAMYNVNAYRSQYGLSFVTGDPLLHQCAQIRSQELITLFDHTRPNGSLCYTVAQEVGCELNVFSENIAGGFADGYSAVNAWMNSPGHRANILNANNEYMGVGASYGGTYRVNWAQMFAVS